MVNRDDPQPPQFLPTTSGGHSTDREPDAAVRQQIIDVANRYPGLDANGVYEEMIALRQTVSRGEVRAVMRRLGRG